MQYFAHFLIPALVSALFSALFLFGPACSATEVTEELDKLEKTFFQHSYPKDPLDHRLARLEKFTFGETAKGTVEGRIGRIEAVVKSNQALAPEANSSTKASQPEKPASPQETAAATGDYPHITFLEDELLGSEHDGEPIEKRLSRLESHAFGKVTASDDLSERTDALERYAVTALHKRPFIKDKVNSHRQSRSMPHFPTSFPSINPDDIAAASDTPPSPHARMLSRIAWCEKHTFGRTYPELHLLQRLHQLNASLFPKDNEKDIQLMDRVNDMVKKVVMVQHPPKTALK